MKVNSEVLKQLNELSYVIDQILHELDNHEDVLAFQAEQSATDIRYAKIRSLANQSALTIVLKEMEKLNDKLLEDVTA